MGPVIVIPYEGRVDMYDDAASWCCRALTCIVYVCVSVCAVGTDECWLDT